MVTLEGVFVIGANVRVYDNSTLEGGFQDAAVDAGNDSKVFKLFNKLAEEF